MVVQPDGKVVVVGATFRDFAPAVARYKPNGTLDTSFSGDGRQTTDFGVANAVALQADGKIVVVGSIDSSFALARTTRTAPSIRASPATASRRLASGGLAKTRRPE